MCVLNAYFQLKIPDFLMGWCISWIARSSA